MNVIGPQLVSQKLFGMNRRRMKNQNRNHFYDLIVMDKYYRKYIENSYFIREPGFFEKTARKNFMDSVLIDYHPF